MSTIQTEILAEVKFDPEMLIQLAEANRQDKDKKLIPDEEEDDIFKHINMNEFMPSTDDDTFDMDEHIVDSLESDD